MTTQNLFYFVEIAKDMNLSVTAERLFVSQQSLSGHIRRLESYFGVRLFERRHNLILTEEGHILLREAKSILASEQRLFEQFHHNVPGPEIRVACHMARTQSYLPDAIFTMSAQFPDVKISCVDAELVNISQLFAENALELSIGSQPEDFPGMKSIRIGSTPGCILIADSLLRRYFGSETEVFVAHARKGIELSELPQEIPIIQSGIINGTSWICKRLPEIRSRPHAGNIEANSKMQLQLHLEACQKGIAMLLVSEMYVKYLKQNLSPEKLDSIYIFPHLLMGAPLMRDEFLTYNDNIIHHQAFWFFLQCIRNNIAEHIS